MKFTKMHGLGNDYIYIDAFEEVVRDPQPLARRLSDRHFGIGGDGLILISPSRVDGADCRMEMYNADGSRAQMCGNGLRCVAKYAFDRGLVRSSELRVETDSGVKQAHVLEQESGRARMVEVEMGAPRLDRASLPLVDGVESSEPAVALTIDVAGHAFCGTAVSMGNPHWVVNIDDPGHAPSPLGSLDAMDIETWGPQFEAHPWFPERVNTEFIVVNSRSEVDMRVWERGSGETLACGTGACAVVVAGVLNGWCDPEVGVQLRGGELRVRWERPSGDGGGSVYLCGAATEVFEGVWPSG